MSVLVHGTAGAYTNHGCRCFDCRRTWTAYNKENRRKRKARGICIQCERPRFKERVGVRVKKHVRCKEHHQALPKRSSRR